MWCLIIHVWVAVFSSGLYAIMSDGNASLRVLQNTLFLNFPLTSQFGCSVHGVTHIVCKLELHRVNLRSALIGIQWVEQGESWCKSNAGFGMRDVQMLQDAVQSQFHGNIHISPSSVSTGGNTEGPQSWFWGGEIFVVFHSTLKPQVCNPNVCPLPETWGFKTGRNNTLT